MPPAPPRLSTITFWPMFSAIFSATVRPSRSVEPPGGYGTTSLIGLAG